MKRIVFFLFCICHCQFAAWSQIIPRMIDGITLGESTSAEMKSILRLKGLDVESDAYGVWGFSSEGVMASLNGLKGSTIYSELVFDKVEVLSIWDSCMSKECEAYFSKQFDELKERFNGLPDAKTAVLKHFKDAYPFLAEDCWAREDTSGTILILSATESGVRSMMVTTLSGILSRMFMIGLELKAAAMDEGNDVESVAGCAFGSSVEHVVNKLESRTLMRPMIRPSEVIFFGIEIGGTMYDAANFYFVNGKLVSVSLQKKYQLYERKKAESTYNVVVDQYKRKYTNLVNLDSDEKKVSLCGKRYELADGSKEYPIQISCSKSLSKGGDYYYYVVVDYFGSKRSQIYDGDI